MNKKITKQWQGLHAHRYEKEPLEHKLALAFQEFCETGGDKSISHLDYLLCEGDQRYVVPCSDRDRQVACTVIQWLGSSVGQKFLNDIYFNR